jgi:hypothetical protein
MKKGAGRQTGVKYIGLGMENMQTFTSEYHFTTSRNILSHDAVVSEKNERSRQLKFSKESRSLGCYVEMFRRLQRLALQI